jgi:hypothetical protein
MDIARMVSQIMGGGESVAEPQAATASAENESTGASAPFPDDSASQKTEPDLPVQAVRLSSEVQKLSNNAETAPSNAAAEPDSDESSAAAPQQAVRRHGSAKPVV